MASPEADFGIIDDLAQLGGDPTYIVKGKPDESLVYRRIGSLRDMPPTGNPRPSAAEIATVRDWILAGALPGAGAAPAEVRPFISDEAILRAIVADLRAGDPTRRSNFRYLTLTNLYNAGVDATSLARFRSAISKLVNSLSWSPTIYVPVAIDANKTVFRIDLGGLRGPDGLPWTPRTWDTILERPYPYAIEYDTQLADEVCRLTGTTTAFIRADWFAFEATQAPLYNTLLGLPTSVTRLESMLGIDVPGNVRAGAAQRAGFVQSGVSDNNRMIERHNIRKWPGAYWRSYDFKTSAATRELRSHPLGPLDFLESPTAAIRQAIFEHDGGEIIFNLPNGMQGYMLIDAVGDRLEVGPSEIVFDKLNNSTKRGVIVNAISCFGCHAGGMQPARDEVRAYAASTLSPAVRDEVNRLYVDNAVLQSRIQADAERFVNAATAAGLTKADFDPTLEPVTSLSKRFNTRLFAGDAAAEVGLEMSVLLDRLGGDLYDLKQSLQISGVARAEFIGRFEAIVKGLRLGELRSREVSVATESRYERGCEIGDWDRCEQLGLALLDGEKLPKNLAQGELFLRRACDGQHWEACAYLGLEYASGETLRKNTQAAQALIDRACSANDAIGCGMLGFLYENGDLVDTSTHSRALASYDKACELAFGAGRDEGYRLLAVGQCNTLGAIFFDRTQLGVPTDKARAFAYFLKACDGGLGVGCQNVANQYKSGLADTGFTLPRDTALAIRYYDKACSLGDKTSCDAARTLRAEPVRRDPPAPTTSSVPPVAPQESEPVPEFKDRIISLSIGPEVRKRFRIVGAVRTGIDGRFAIRVRPGTYIVATEKSGSGFASIWANDVRVRDSSGARMEIHLRRGRESEVIAQNDSVQGAAFPGFIEGIVRGENGEPIPFVIIKVLMEI